MLEVEEVEETELERELDADRSEQALSGEERAKL
jgi:hypothetical protein